MQGKFYGFHDKKIIFYHENLIVMEGWCSLESSSTAPVEIHEYELKTR